MVKSHYIEIRIRKYLCKSTPGHLRHKQDRKELECDPVWHLVAVSRVRPCTMDRKKVEFLVWHLSAGLE